jgi:uncharacterized protein (TIGR00106 family)
LNAHDYKQREGKMAIMEISVIPMGAGTSVSKYVAEAILAIESIPNIDYETTSMGTIIAGELEDLLTVAQRMHQVVLNAGVQRVVTNIRIDDRTDKKITLKSKLDSLKKALGDRD